VSGVDVGRILRGGMLAVVAERLDNGLRWMSRTVDLKLGSKPKGSGGSGGFGGGRTPLGSDPRSQLFIVASVVARHFFIKERKLVFLSEGILSFVTWLAFRAQLS
jgi:glycerate kinase